MTARATLPAVFTQPVDAPYLPATPPEDRRIAAVADGLAGHRYAQMSQYTRPSPLPDGWAATINKLAREAGLAAATHASFVKEAETILRRGGVA